MVSFIQIVLALCTMRSGPQDMPVGRGYLLSAAALYSIVMVAVFSLSQWQLAPAFLALQSTVALALVTAIILSLAGVSARTPQTLTALYASSCLLNLAYLLLIACAELGIFLFLINTVIIGLFFWSMAIDAYIFSRALNTNLWMGLAVAMSIYIFSQVLLSPWQATV